MLNPHYTIKKSDEQLTKEAEKRLFAVKAKIARTRGSKHLKATNSIIRKAAKHSLGNCEYCGAEISIHSNGVKFEDKLFCTYGCKYYWQEDKE